MFSSCFWLHIIRLGYKIFWPSLVEVGLS